MHTKEKSIYIVILIACSFLAIILLYFFYSILKYHKRDLKGKLEIIYGKKGVLEEEKKRVGREIHDGVSSTLAGIKLMVESVQGVSEKDQKRLTSISVGLNESLKNLRYIMNDLMEINLRTQTLFQAIQDYLDRMNLEKDSTQLTIDYDFRCVFEFAEEKALHIYRIFQEVVTNTRKHSQASLLKIRAVDLDNFIELTFKDNGIGFDSGQKMLSNSGIGLSNIVFRTEMVNGTHSIHSEKNKGTEIKLKIPK